jgi:LysM repeat protein
MGNPALRVELDRLAGLGLTLRGLATEAASLQTGQPAGLSCPAPAPGGTEPAVLEASGIAHDLIDTTLVTTIKDRLSETGPIMVDVANQYRNADETTTSLATAMKTYTNATGTWHVPKTPTSPTAQSVSVPHPTPTPRPAVLTYRVVYGDTLWTISERFYGDPLQYQRIADASDISDPNVIFPGQVVKIPPDRKDQR